MPMNAEALLSKLARYHDLSVSALTRAMQYAGYETGRKARTRFEHYQQKFTETLEALLALTGGREER